MSRKEDEYLIERMGKLLAEIAVIVNGPEPPLTRWSYHDLPDKVRALKAQQPAAAVPLPASHIDAQIERARAFVPEGYAMVPVEPTREMMQAGEVALEEWWGGKTQEPSFAVVYRAMLAAALAERNNTGDNP